MALAVITKYPNSTFYTTKLEIKFKSSIDKGHIFAKAQLVDKKRNFIFGKDSGFFKGDEFLPEHGCRRFRKIYKREDFLAIVDGIWYYRIYNHYKK